jgi:hypothetical protein
MGKTFKRNKSGGNFKREKDRAVKFRTIRRDKKDTKSQFERER